MDGSRMWAMWALAHAVKKNSNEIYIMPKPVTISMDRRIKKNKLNGCVLMIRK